MPFGNGTGPAGMGPMTGRGLGNCAGYENPGSYSRGRMGRGRGFSGRGRGSGRMAGRRFFAEEGFYGRPLSKEEEQAGMKSHADFLRSELEILEQQMKKAESEPDN